MTQRTWPRRRPVPRVTTWVAAVGLLLALAPSGAVLAAPPAPSVPRVLSNVQGAIAWSRFTFADGAASTVLLARDDNFVDTFTSGPVQGALNAPLLLTNSRRLSPETATELKRLGAKRVIIIGGTPAISPGVENETKALNLTTERVGGANPAETAVAVAARFFPTASTALIAPVAPPAFADSLPASTFAAQKKIPILLTETAKLSVPTEQYLKGASPHGSKLQTFVIAGGESSVGPAVAAALAALKPAGTAGGNKAQVTRVSGANRFATAVEFDKQLGYADAKASPRVVLLQGQGTNWSNGFASAASVGKGSGTAMVLINGETLPPESATFLNGGSKTPLVCGPGVSKNACDEAGKLLGFTPKT
jgi:putative cell wall-binding protein